MRNTETVRKVIGSLEQLGVEILNKDLFFVERSRDRKGKIFFMKEHLAALKRVDLVYVINPTGYVG
ncbi:MAG: hypothetical protein NWF14_05950 [Candidatus Bathyarchaeota archaeon]|nr:hypothetical protein [Candidatus Bathyarchaeota archaeon]